jgi:hypothetical protein
MHPWAYHRQLVWRLRWNAWASAQAQQRSEQAQARAHLRRERRVEKARRRLPVQGVVAAGAGVSAMAVGGDVVMGSVSMAALLLAVRSLSVLYGPEPRPLPPVAAAPAPPLPPLPPRGSVAFPYLRRLEAVRDELRRMLPLVGPAGRAAGEEAWHAAAEADAALRWQAARVAAVEAHRPADDGLLRALEEGVRCQERLVSAVADLVAASADPLTTGRLQDATDALHGLAQGLRELR